MTHETVSGKKTTKSLPIIIGGIIVFALIAGGSFYSGVAYQKSQTQQSPFAAGISRQGGFGGGQMGPRRDGNMGEVTKVSNGSITISMANPGLGSSDQSANEMKTFSITSETKVLNDGEAVDIATVKVGDTVSVRADSSDDSKAFRIIIGGFSSPTSSEGSTSSSAGDAQSY